jgi:hypothetical protein
MTHVLVVAGGLIFEQDWDQVPPGFAPDRLARRLRQARRAWHAMTSPWSDGAAHLQWLARAFAVPGDPPASAAYSWRAATGDRGAEAANGQAWFCEPVHLSLEPERTVLAPIDTPPLTETEHRELFHEAAEAADGHGALLKHAAGRWYLFPRQTWDLRTIPLQAVLGASIEARLPQGGHALRWRGLLNEVQMRWHANRVNRERESRGQQIVNGLWLHGGGLWRPLEPSRFDRVHTDDTVVLGWSQAGRSDSNANPPSDALTLWPQLFEPYWRRDWSAWGASWAQLDLQIESLLNSSGPQRGLELVVCGRRGAASFTLGRSAAVLPWRRRTLRECLLEPVTP